MSLFGDVTHCRKTLCVALQALLIGVDPMTQNNERITKTKTWNGKIRYYETNKQAELPKLTD